MENEIRIKAPIDKLEAKKLKSGDRVLISGTIITGRDAAHKKMSEIIQNGGELPFDLRGEIIYYVGTCPPKPGYAVGSAGPTTSGRMDKFTPMLLDLGLIGMIGKGQRNDEVVEAMIRNGAVYFAAIGGAAVLIANSIKKEEIIAFPELGTEAVKKLWVEDFPAIVVIDSDGNNLYNTEVLKYKNKFSITNERESGYE